MVHLPPYTGPAGSFVRSECNYWKVKVISENRSFVFETGKSKSV